METDSSADIVAWELEPGERPTWIGTPEPGAYVRATTRWGTVLLALPASVVGWSLITIAPPLGLLFASAGFCMLGSPLWNYLKARNTIYVITDQRLIVIERLGRQSARGYPGGRLTEIERRYSGRGTGSLVFSRVRFTVERHDGFNHSMVEEQGFFGIRNVSQVWRMMMALKNQEAGC